MDLEDQGQGRGEKAAPKDINLLLVGKSGDGISSTLKSITGQSDVEIKGGWTPVTLNYLVKHVEIGGRNITVVDTPGIVEDDTTRVKQTRSSVVQACEEFPGGFNAVVLVMSYSGRFNQGHATVIESLKKILADDRWLQTHGIVLVTSGDNFQRDFKDIDFTFEKWCKEQTGFIRQVFQDCNYRCVLFDNVTEDPHLVERQRQNLISIVDKLEQERFVVSERTLYDTIGTLIEMIMYRLSTRRCVMVGVCLAMVVATCLGGVGKCLVNYVGSFWPLRSLSRKDLPS